MFNVWPSPLLPLTVAVTTTSWSFATKFLMQRSLLADSWPGWAWMSNLRAAMRGRRKAKRSSSAKSMLAGVARRRWISVLRGWCWRYATRELSRCLGHAAVGGVKGSLRFGSRSAERDSELEYGTNLPVHHQHPKSTFLTQDVSSAFSCNPDRVLDTSPFEIEIETKDPNPERLTSPWSWLWTRRRRSVSVVNHKGFIYMYEAHALGLFSIQRTSCFSPQGFNYHWGIYH
jgi:hypothetical protein